jgi:hypothetical protein
MPANPTTQQMGEKHEVFLAEVNGGTRSKASGSQWDDPADGRSPHDGPLAFAWDGKSTRGEGLTITLKMIAKIREQALSERPEIGLRWYANDNLDQVAEDWIAVPAADFRELLELARKLAGLEAEHGDVAALIPVLHRQLGEAREREEMAESRFRQLSAAASDGRIVPPAVPALPWTVVYQVHLEGHVVTSGMHFEPTGKMTPFKVSTIRVERTTRNLPRLIVNETLIREGDLYVDGALSVRVSQSNPLAAKG